MKCELCQQEGADYRGSRFLCQACNNLPRTRYYLVNRPPSQYTMEPGWVNYETWSPPRNPGDGTGWRYHGFVEYACALDFEMVWKWELRPADPHELEMYQDWRDEVGK